VDREITIAKALQSITFNPVPPQTFGGAPYLLTGSATSTLEVFYSVLSGPGTLESGSLITLGAGSLVLRAEQLGNSNYLPA